jgi:hypothetical protein
MTLPVPPTPAESDLRDFAKIMIDIPRLMGSQFNAIASRNPLAWMIGHKLWYRAWHQVPAGSLPDDDDQLCHLAELGFDIKSFRKAKTIALHGWFRCSDGRLYHATVSEAVNKAWRQKLEQRWRTECARIRKANERNNTAFPTPTFDEWLAAKSAPVTCDIPLMSHVTEPPVTQDDPPMSHDCPTRNGLQERGRGILKKEEEANASVGSAPPTPTKAEPWKHDPDFQRFWRAASPDARGRTSQAKTWGPFDKAAKAAGGRAVIADAYGRYAAEDRDVQRTGGPGLHVWLNDRRWEHWLSPGPDPAAMSDADWETAIRLWRTQRDWLDRFGPRPGEPGCRVPIHLILADASAKLEAAS